MKTNWYFHHLGLFKDFCLDTDSTMKIKEIKLTANIAWSPAAQYPIYLAAGTAAQQFDASFSTTSQLDLYSLDLNDPGCGMTKAASISTSHRLESR